jgi:hypothetical protein
MRWERQAAHMGYKCIQRFGTRTSRRTDRDHEDISIDGRAILKQMLQRQDGFELDSFGSR